MLGMTKKEILNDTLIAFQKGFYLLGDNPVKFKLTTSEMQKTMVYLPQEIDGLKVKMTQPHSFPIEKNKCKYYCENVDSYDMACQRFADCEYTHAPAKQPDILVLNMANPFTPGGGVRRGASAQEEDLCRTSSLLLSLESKEAEEFYSFNRTFGSYLGTNAVIISPWVEIIKERSGLERERTVVVSVITCAAPVYQIDRYGLSENEYNKVIFNRIVDMLIVAAHYGYCHLIMGAFGCGAFRNDPYVVSQLFYDALHGQNTGELGMDRWFNEVDFAVLDKSSTQRNYKAFLRLFNNDNFGE